MRHMPPLAALGAAILLASRPACAAEPASAADRAFVAMVSQGGMFEVQAGAAAVAQGSSQDIRDQGAAEQHDHMLVGDRLTAAAGAAGIAFPAALNSTFAAMLARLSAAGSRFDATFSG